MKNTQETKQSKLAAKPETKNIVCRMYAQATADILQPYIVHTYARSMFPYAPRMLAYVLLD